MDKDKYDEMHFDMLDIEAEMAKDEPKEVIDCPTDIEAFWDSIETAIKVLGDAEQHLARSAFSERPGEIGVTENFMNIKCGVEKVLYELKDVEDNKRG